MNIYLISKPDEKGSTYKPFGISYGDDGSSYVGFKNKELAEYFISIVFKEEGYEPVKIDQLPADKLDEYEKVMIVESEANIRSIFSGKIKTLFKKSKPVSKLTIVNISI